MNPLLNPTYQRLHSRDSYYQKRRKKTSPKIQTLNEKNRVLFEQIKDTVLLSMLSIQCIKNSILHDSFIVQTVDVAVSLANSRHCSTFR